MLGAVEVFSAGWNCGFPAPFLPKIGEVADSTSKHVLWLDAWGCLKFNATMAIAQDFQLVWIVNCQSNEGLKDLMKDFIYRSTASLTPFTGPSTPKMGSEHGRVMERPATIQFECGTRTISGGH